MFIFFFLNNSIMFIHSTVQVKTIIHTHVTIIHTHTVLYILHDFSSSQHSSKMSYIYRPST